MTITDLTIRTAAATYFCFGDMEAPVEFNLAGTCFQTKTTYAEGTEPDPTEVRRTITRDLLSTLECNGFTLLPTEE